MPRLWKQTVETHRREVRESVLDAAARLAEQRGVRGVTMSEVAEGAGIGRATLYKYFADVETILLAWHEREIAGHLAQLAEASARSDDPVERLRGVLETYASLAHGTHGHHNSDLAAFLHRDQSVSHAEQQVLALVAGLIEDAAAADALRGDVPAAELATFCVHSLAAARTSPSKAAVGRLVTLTLDALRRSPT